MHNRSSLLPERNFLGAVPFARQTSGAAVENTGNVMGHSTRTVAVTAERGGVCEDCQIWKKTLSCGKATFRYYQPSHHSWTVANPKVLLQSLFNFKIVNSLKTLS